MPIALVLRRSLAVWFLLLGCGGDDADEGEPLVGGSVVGEYDGETFTATFGFATVYEGSPIVAFGDDGLHCGSEQGSVPPDGHSAVVSFEAFEVGSHEGFVQIFTNVDEFEGFGTGGASLTLASVSDATVAGSVEWQAEDEGRQFSLSGSFEVVRCSP